MKIKTGKYQHYKNKKFYKVIGVAIHSETLEEVVIYRALYDSEKFGKNALWVRPKKMFLEKIKYNDHLVSRFKYIGKQFTT